MRNRDNLRGDLASLKLQFNSPLILKTVIQDFKDYLITKFGDEPKICQDDLREYLLSLSDEFFKSLYLDNISSETNRLNGLIKDIRKEKYIKFDVFENGNYEEANKLLRDIYDKWNNVQLRLEVCNEHIILIKKALVYLNSFKKVIISFIQDNSAHGVNFNTVADSKRFTEIIVVSIDSYIEVLKSQTSEISSWIDMILSPKINMLMRGESSLRLLAKYSDWDYGNRCGNTEQRGYSEKSGDSTPSKFNGCSNFKL